MCNLLFCATDAGGMRNLLPLLQEAAGQGCQVTFVTSAKLHHLFCRENSTYKLFFAEDVEGKVESLLAAVSPTAVICGTTCHPSVDRDFLSCAKRRDVRSIAVVDEWYNYVYRFSSNSQNVLSCLPSIIALPDAQAVCEAVSEGIPVDLCHATGSPSLADIWNRGRLWQTTPPQSPVVMEGVNGRTVIVFLSETHALDYGKRPGDSGLMGDYLGYTEIMVRDLIMNVLSLFPSEFVFIDKLHPSAYETEIPSGVPANVEYRATRDAPTLEVCAHSDAVIGMRSMALLEAGLLGCNVVSFQPGLIGVEQCSAVRLGFVKGLHTSEELYSWLCEKKMKAQTGVFFDAPPPFACAEAAKKIIQLALGAKAI